MIVIITYTERVYVCDLYVYDASKGVCELECIRE